MILILLVTIAAASISYEATYSPLKSILFLDKEYPLVQLLTSFKVYKKLFNFAAYFLLPVILPLMVLAKIHIYLFKLLNCQYCLSFWTGVLLAYIFSYSFPLIVLIGGLSIFVQSLYTYLKMKLI